MEVHIIGQCISYIIESKIKKFWNYFDPHIILSELLLLLGIDKILK